MDYHLIPNLESNSPNLKKGYYGKLLKRFVPVFTIAALLPMFMAIVVSPPNLSFIPKADSKPTLRLWVEPTNVTAKAREVVNFEVFAEYENQNETIHNITFNLELIPQTNTTPQALSYKNPFDGRVKIADVAVQIPGSDNYKLEIDKNSVKTPIPGVEIITGSSTISQIPEMQ